MSSSSLQTFHSCASLQLDGASGSKEITNTNTQVTNISEDDFKLLQLVGKGSFGKVYQVKKKNGRDINKIYAMKVLDKKSLTNLKETSRHAERNILMKVKHPFIVELFYIFQNRASVFYILEYLCGGELRAILKRQKVLSEKDASFYIKEIVLSLEYLHSQGIIYRDLKPNNILLDRQGHVKVIDFGLSKDNMGDGKLSYTICGSPSYVAPEVLRRKGHGTSADWWSMGVLFYVMVVGKKPFKITIKEFAKADYNSYLKPKNLSLEAETLITELLEVNPMVRLGSRGDNMVKQHPFFQNTCWDGVFHRQEVPPFLPHNQEKSDAAELDPKILTEETFKSSNSLFASFNYINPVLLEEDTSLNSVTVNMSNLSL